MTRLRPRNPPQLPGPAPLTRRERIWQYVRFILASGLIGIGFGYYLQVIGSVEMDGFLIFAFACRAMIIGAFVCAFEIFYVNAPSGARLGARSRGNRLAIKVVAYFVLFEIGFGLGWVLFNFQEALNLAG